MSFRDETLSLGFTPITTLPLEQTEEQSETDSILEAIDETRLILLNYLIVNNLSDQLEDGLNSSAEEILEVFEANGVDPI